MSINKELDLDLVANTLDRIGNVSIDEELKMDLEVRWSPAASTNTRQKVVVPVRGALHPSKFSGIEGTTVSHHLNPPDPTVVQGALSLLIESVKTANRDYITDIKDPVGFERNANGRLSELVKVACQALIREADTRSADLRRVHDRKATEYRDQRMAEYEQNSSLPIHKIPIELFRGILEMVMHEGSINAILWPLARVSKYWKQVVISTPQWWSRLNDNMSETDLRWSLYWSNGALLDVSSYPGEDLGDSYSRTVASVSEQWRSLQGRYVPQMVLSRLKSHAPVLQHLRLVGRGFSSSADTTNRRPVELGEGLGLTSLSLERVYTTWNHSRLGNLRSLVLTSISGSYAPSLPQLICLVSSSQRLEELKIVCLELKSSAEEERLPVEKVNLPNLVSFVLLNMSWGSYNRILSRVQLPLPSCRQLQLMEWRSRSVGADETFDYLNDEFIEQIRSMAEIAGAPHISFNDRQVLLKIGSSAVAEWGLGLRLESRQVFGDQTTKQMGQIIVKALLNEPVTLDNVLRAAVVTTVGPRGYPLLLPIPFLPISSAPSSSTLEMLAANALFRRANNTSNDNNAMISVPLTNLGNQVYTVNVQLGTTGDAQDFALSIANTYGYTAVASKCHACTTDGTAPRYNSSASQTYSASSNATTSFKLNGNTISGTLGTDECALEKADGTWWGHNGQTNNVTNSNTMLVGSGILGFGQSDVPIASDSLIGQYLASNNSSQDPFVFAVALNGSTTAEGAAIGTYGGVVHINGTDPSFYSGPLATLSVISTSEQASFDTLPPQLGSYDWTVRMQSWILSFTNGSIGVQVSGGQGGMYATFESAYPYILLPLADAEQIYSSIPGAQNYTLPVNATTTAGTRLTQDLLAQSWSVPCGSVNNVSISFNFTTVSVPVLSQDLWEDLGGGVCVGNVKGWIDPARTTAIMGSVFWRGAYIVFSAYLNTELNTIGFANRNPLIVVGTATTVKHNQHVLIGGVIGGVAFLLVVLAVVVMFLRRARRAKKAHVAPSAMFIQGQKATPPATPLPCEPFYQPEASERGDTKSIFSGFSGTAASLSSKYLPRRDQDPSQSPTREKEKDGYWVEPWVSVDKSAGVVKAKDEGVVVMPWVPMRQSETVSLSPMASLNGSAATTLAYQASSPPTSFQRDSMGSEAPSPTQKSLPSPPTPITDLLQDLRSQSVLSHNTAAPSYATHDYALGPSHPPHHANSSTVAAARNQPLPRRLSDHRIGTESRSTSSSSRMPPSAFINPIPPPSSLGSNIQPPLSDSPSEAFDPAMDAHRSTSITGSTRTARTVRPLPTAPLSCAFAPTMPSATDIITYIGVPLAVVGVMPVMYTCSTAIITRHKVLRTVQDNNVEVTTRIGILSGVIEVDFPRYTIHPHRRSDDSYWKDTDGASSLKGGSWTLLQWQKVKTGKATYRIQHSDELRQPQAEIQLTDLFTFLLDRGATPSAHGLQLLRIMGLQTPPGTVLLVCGSHPVLTVATPDESEGHLSLKLHWTDEMRVRSSESLPPYWVRVFSRKIFGDQAKNPPVRLFLGVDGLETALLEANDTILEKAEKQQEKEKDKDKDKDKDKEDRCDQSSWRSSSEGGVDIDHLRTDSRCPGPVSLWFACAVVAICGQDQAGLFRFSIPPRILTFAKRDSIPHGLLVLLGMRNEDETPLGRERLELRNKMAHEKRSRELMDQGRRMQQMTTMSSAERQKAMAEEGQATLRRMADERRQRQVEELERRAEALSSPRISTRVVAEAAFEWLKANGHVHGGSHPEITMSYLAHSILHSMVFDKVLAVSIAGILDSWIGWTDTVINDAHCDVLRQNQADFCYAAVLLNEIAEYEINGKVHPVARDLDECQRVWKTV
ncbi:hypothetical protein FRB97_006195, partial [Tulasnella sp. 331]